MCGISGAFAPYGTDEQAADRVRVMMGGLAHRGPDGQGTWCDPRLPLAFGHNRLAIMDRSLAGAQPMLSASQRYVLNFNGEIYNFHRLRQAIDASSAAPIAWRGHSDSEVLVEAVGAWGVEGALARIEGMFAFAVWDRIDRKLWLARDRAGEKPLFYGWIGKLFAFASELGAIRDAFGVQLSINDAVLGDFLRGGYIPAPATIYQGIAKLAPGHLVYVDASGERAAPVASRRYWSLRDVLDENVTTTSDRAAPAADRMEAALRQAVSERMMGDVPVGAFLSGGLDSSLIVAMMAQQSQTPVHTFTVSYEDPEYDESRYAAQVVRQFPNVTHASVTVTPADYLELAPKAGAMFGEPFADASHIPTFILARLARNSVAVALSGEGADELFGGYDKYFDAERIWRVLSRIPLGVRRMVAPLLAIPSVGAWNEFLKYASPRNRGPHVDGDKVHKLVATLRAADRHEFYTVLSGSWRPPEDAILHDSRASQPALEPLQRLQFVEEMMALDFETSLPHGILTKIDRTTMAVGLESRAPFLAESIVALAWNLPIAIRVNGKGGKRILREIAAKYLPAAIIDREKKGFPTPIAAWLRGPLRPWAEELLEARRLETSGFRASRVREVWHEHRSGQRNWQYALWPVLMWQAFFTEGESTRKVA